MRQMATRVALFGVLVVVGCGGESSKRSSPSPLGSGSHSIEGVCEDDEDAPNFTIAPGSGTLTATVSWDESTGDDIDVVLIDYDSDAPGNSVTLDMDIDSPPGDSPAEVSGTVTEAMEILLLLGCPSGTNIEFSGTVVVP